MLRQNVRLQKMKQEDESTERALALRQRDMMLGLLKEEQQEPHKMCTRDLLEQLKEKWQESHHDRSEFYGEAMRRLGKKPEETEEKEENVKQKEGFRFSISKPGFLAATKNCHVALWRLLHRISVPPLAVYETPKSFTLVVDSQESSSRASRFLKALLGVQKVDTYEGLIPIRPPSLWDWDLTDLNHKKWAILVETNSGSLPALLQLSSESPSGSLTYLQNTVPLKATKDRAKQMIMLETAFTAPAFPFKKIFIRTTSGGEFVEGYMLEPEAGSLYGTAAGTEINEYKEIGNKNFEKIFGAPERNPLKKGRCRRCGNESVQKYCGTTGELHEAQILEETTHAIKYGEHNFIRSGVSSYDSMAGDACISRERTPTGSVKPCGRWFYKSRDLIEAAPSLLGSYHSGQKCERNMEPSPATGGTTRCPACFMKSLDASPVCGNCSFSFARQDCVDMFSTWSVKIPSLGISFLMDTNLSEDGSECTGIVTHEKSKIMCTDVVHDHSWGAVVNLQLRSALLTLCTQPAQPTEFMSLRGSLLDAAGGIHNAIFSYLPKKTLADPPTQSPSRESSASSDNSFVVQDVSPTFAEKVHPLLTQLEKLTKIRANRPNSGKYTHEYVAQISHALEVIQVQKPEEDTAINVVQGLCKAIEEKGSTSSDESDDDDFEIYACTGDLQNETWERVATSRQNKERSQEKLARAREEIFSGNDEIVELMLSSDEAGGCLDLEDQHQMVFEILSSDEPDVSKLTSPAPTPKQVPSWPPISASSTDPTIAASFLPVFSDQDLD